MRIVRRILIGLLGLVAFLLVLLVVAVAWFNTGIGQRQLASLISSLASSEDSGVEIGRIDGFVPFDLTVGDVALSDRDGQWLTIDRAALDWAPFALIGGRLHVVSLDAGTVAMLRQPAPSTSAAPEEPTPLEPPSLPFDIELDRLSVDRVELPTDLVGEPMAFSVSGDAQLGEPSEGLRTDLTIDRLDGPPGHIGLNASFVSGGRLTFDLSVDEPREGLIAGLAGWPLDTPVSISLQGDGTLDAFAADLAATVGDLASASGSASIERANDGRVFRLSVRSDIAALMPADIQPMLAGEVIVDVDGTLGDDGSLSLETLGLDAAAGRVSASGSLAATGELSGDLSFTAGASTLFASILPDADWSDLQLNVTLAGTRQAPIATVTIDAEEFAIAGISADDLSTTIDASLPNGLADATSSIGFDLSLNANGFALGDADLDPLLTTVDLAASGTLDDTSTVTLNSLSATVPAGTVSGSGSALIDGSDIAFDGNIDVPDASQFASLSGLPLSGSLAVDVNAQMAGDAVSATLDASADEVSFGQQQAEALLGDSWTLSVTADGTTAGTVSDATVSVVGQSVGATVQGSWDGTAVDGQVSATVSALQQLVPDMEGSVDVEAAVQGVPEFLATQLTLTSASLTAGGEQFTDISINADLTDLPSAPSGTIDIAATAQGQPVAVSLTSQQIDTSGTSPIDLETLSLSFGAFQLAGSVRFDPTTLAATGGLSGGIDDLASLNDLHGQEISGQASVELTLDWAEDAGQSADLQVSADQLSVPGGVSIGALQLSASGSDLLAAPGIDVTVNASAVEAATAAVETLNLSADGVDILGADGLHVTGSAAGVSYTGVGSVGSLDFDIGATDLSGEPVIDVTMDLGEIVIDTESLDAATVTATIRNPGGDMSAEARIESADADVDVTANLTTVEGGQRFDLSTQSEIRNVEGTDLAALGRQPVTLDLSLLIGDDGSLSLEQADLDGGVGTITATGGVAADGALSVSLTIDADTPALVHPYVSDADWSSLTVAIDVGGTVELPTVDVSVTGTDVVASGQQVGALDLTVDASFPDGLQDPQPTIAFATTLDASDLTLADAALAPLATTLNLSASGQIDGLSTVALSQLSVTAPVGTVDGAGSAALDGGAIQFDGTVNVTDASLLADLAGQSLSGALESTIALSLENDAFSASIDATADGLGLGQAVADGLLGDSWQLTVDADGSLAGTISQASVTLAGQSAEIDATGSWDGANVAAEADVTVSDLAAIAPDIDGSAQANASISGPLDALSAQVALTSSAVNASGETVEDLTLNADLTDIPSAITGSIDLTGSVGGRPVALTIDSRPLDPSGDSPIDLETVSLQFGSLQLDGTIRFDPTTLAAVGSLEGQVDDLSSLDELIDQPLTGAATLAVTLDQTDEDGQTAQLRVTGTGLAFGDVATASSLEVTADATDLLGTPGLDLTAVAQAVDAADVSVETLTLTANGDDILGSDGIRLRGSATGASYADLVSAGGLEFDVTGRDLGTVPSIDADIDATTLDVAGQRFGTAAIVATLDDPAGDLTFDASVDGTSALAGGLDFSTLRATATGSPASMSWTVDGQQSGAAVSGAGQVSIADTISIALETLALSASGESFALASPNTITIGEDGTIDLGSMSLTAAGGSLQVSGTVAEALNLNVNASDVPLRLVALAAPGAEVTGVINGSATISGTADAPQGQYDLRATGVGTPETEAVGLGSYDVSVTGTLSAGSTQFDGELTGTGSRLSVTGTVPTGGAGSVQVTGEGSFDLSVLNPLLAAGADTVGGTLAINLTASGSMSDLTASGTVNLRDGSFRNALYGVELTAIEIDMNASTDELVVSRLTAQTPNGGTIGGSGSITLDPSRGLPVEVQVQADDAALLDMPAVAAIADANLTFTGSLAQGGELSGTVRLEQVEARLDNLGTASVPTIDVIEINPSTPEEAERIERARAAAAGDQTATAFDIALDVEVSAPNQVFVRGSGLEAEFAGDLTVAGTLNAPSIRGSLDLRRGSYDVLSRHLEFTQGSIRFDGRPIDPLLNFEATTTVDSITATLAVTGRASDPGIEVTSQPPLPQSEILAIILFGRASDSLTAFEAVQLAASAGQLAGIGGGGPGLLQEVRQTLGFDRVDFTTTPGGETAIGIGQNITDNVYVEVDQGVESGDSEVSVEIELTPNITVESGVGTRGSRVGFSVEWDY